MTIDAINRIDSYQPLTTGRRINQASDDPAGLAISQKLQTQITAGEQNGRNVEDFSSLVQTADSAMETIQDKLQEMREVAVRAANGTMTADDRSMYQAHIDQIKEDITRVASNTEFNTVKLLDGSFTDKNVAMNADGSGRQISIQSTTLENLGIENFNVTGSFDISDIDNAIETVSSARSDLGSASNAFEYASAGISNRVINMTASDATLADQVMEEAITNFRTEQVINQYRLTMQQHEMEQMGQKVGMYQDFRV